jgi:hypothetical protein
MTQMQLGRTYHFLLNRKTISKAYMYLKKHDPYGRRREQNKEDTARTVPVKMDEHLFLLEVPLI